MESLVSVIMPIYNVEKYIKEAIDSVINQTYRNLEIILVDDGSPDNCGKICDEYAEKDSRIKVIHKENGGVTSARNVGIGNATGDWIYFCDPDDWIEFELIEKSIGFAVKNNCDMCIFDYAGVYGDKINYIKSLKNNDNVFKELDDINIFITYACAMGTMWNVITKSSIIKELRFDEEIFLGEDEVFKWQLYSKINSFCYLKENLYYYRINPNSVTNSISLKNLQSMRIKIYKKEKDIVDCNAYPVNSVQAVCSKYLELFWLICIHIFNEKNHYHIELLITENM